MGRDVMLHLVSFADFNVERAVGVGRVFDAHPYFRPVKVGGDPARIKVGDSLSELIAKTGLPIDWLTVRVNNSFPEFESGRIKLREGRGGWTGDRNDDGELVYTLSPHQIHAHFLESTVGVSGRLTELETFFADLAGALDACYGFVASTDEWDRHWRWLGQGQPWAFVLRELPNIFWLNCFGPAFVHRWPALAAIPDGRRDLPNGAVIIRTTPDPWPTPHPHEGPFDAEWKADVIAATGTDPFRRLGPTRPLGVHVPTVAEQLAASPGTQEMPWVHFHQEQDEQKRQRKYDRSRERRLHLAEQRPPMSPLGSDAGEWSTSFDLPDWQGFHRRLRRRLKGDLLGPLGTALAAEIASAPLDTEESIDLNTDHGVIRMSWFIDDTDVVDLAVWARPEVLALCHDLAYGEGL